MSEIPEDIMKAAADTLDNALCHDAEAYGGSYEDSRNAAITEIARAILAERERCAKIADRFMEMHIAEAIRNPKP